MLAHCSSPLKIEAFDFSCAFAKVEDGLLINGPEFATFLGVWRRSVTRGDSSDNKQAPGTRRFQAWLVHVFTAFGAAAGLLALERASAADFPLMFAWLGLALLIDGVDGTLARAANVHQHAPQIDGDILDLVVDYLTYVIVPVVALCKAQLMPSWLGAPVLLAVAVASALYFADRRMKTADHWFRGFPALWNVAAFYLLAFAVNGWVAAAIMVVLTALMFAPVVFVHPMRVAQWRSVTLGAGALWLVCAALIAADGMQGPALARWALLLAGLYFLALPLLRGKGPVA